MNHVLGIGLGDDAVDGDDIRVVERGGCCASWMQRRRFSIAVLAVDRTLIATSDSEGYLAL